MAEWGERCRLKLAWLKDVDRGLACFGADTHRYELRDPVAPLVVEALGASLGVPIPADLAAYWTEVGGGGAGPGYGVQHPRTATHHRCDEPFPGTTELRRRAAAAEPYQAWDVWRSVRPFLDDDWEESTVAALVSAGQRAGVIAVPSAPAPSPDYYELPRGELSGLLAVAHQGCGHWSAVVTCGPQTGEVVEINSGGGVWEIAPSFADFYEGWLDSTIERCSLVVELMQDHEVAMEALAEHYRQKFPHGESPDSLVASIAGAVSMHQRQGQIVRLTFPAATEDYEHVLNAWREDASQHIAPPPARR